VLRLVLLFALVLCSRLNAQENIRQVDFRNFTYPLSGRQLGHGSLEWLNVSASPAARGETIHLVDGSQLTKTPDPRFTLQSVTYADLMGDGKEEAIITLLWKSGGTQTTHYVYVYTLEEHGPKLLAYCHTGSRADSGLYHVYAGNGLLVFELFDPAREYAPCCSSGLLISSYKWEHGVFRLEGPVERRTLPSAQEHPE
jgi:hypothetical protein